MAAYPPDYMLIMMMVILMAIALVAAFLMPHLLSPVFSRFPHALRQSIMLLIMLSIANCWHTKRWDLEYILAFLSLRQTEEHSLSRFALLLCYVVIFTYTLRFFVTEVKSSGKSVQLLAERLHIHQSTYTSAETSPFFMEKLFILLPIGLLVLVILSLLRGDFFYSGVWATLLVPLGVIIVNWQKKVAFRIVTDDKGIMFEALLRQTYCTWDEVLSLEVISSAMNQSSFKKGTRAQVITQKGTFRFSPLMKNATEEYPKLKIGMYSWKWVDADGTEKEAITESCPLYLEIADRLNKQHR